MDIPSFIHKSDEYLDRVAKDNTDIRLLAKRSSLEVMKQKIAADSSFYLDSSEDWQGFEFIYVIKGKLEYTDSEPPIELEPGDYISRAEVPGESWFETKTDVTLLTTCTQPAFYLLREEIEDYLQLAEQVESKEGMDGHSKRLVRMSHKLGKRLGLSSEMLTNLKYASFFHDIGKSKVSDQILEKEGGLTEKEWEIMENHTQWGKEMLEGSDCLARAGEIVNQTHERVDGKGYPEGLEGGEISLEARIIAVVDAWDAMRTDRPYRDALSKEEAIVELKRNKETQFDPEVVETFLDLLEEKENLETPTTQERGKYKEEVTQLRQRKKLLDLSKEVLSAESTKDIAGRTLEAVLEATPFQRALISVFDRPIDPENPKLAQVEFFSYKGLSDQQEKGVEEANLEKVDVNVEKFDQKYKLGESYYVPHKERRENFDDPTEIISQLTQEATLDWHPDDSLYIPLYKNKKIIGQISVDDPEDGFVPSPENLRPIESFASLASLGIEKTAQSEQLREWKDKLEALHRAVDQLQDQDTEEDMLRTAVDVAENILDFEICAIATLEGNYLVPKANSANLDPNETTQFKVGEGIAGKTVEKGKSIWGDDVRDYPEAQPTNGVFRAFISVPIGEMGNLQVISKEVAKFTEQDVELAEILAGHLCEELKRVRLEEDLRNKAIRDPLTDLYNRRYFNETLGEEVERCKRYDKSIAFLMADVNRFKEINDRYSHQTGDQVLKEVAGLLKKGVRDADTVVRYGGDEFLIMMTETEKGVGNTVERLQLALDRWNNNSNLLDFPLTLAMGVSYWRPDQDRDVEEALKEADKKMYDDKMDNG